MNWRIQWSFAAQNDALAIWQYIADNNLTAADAQLDRIEASIRLLIKTPKIGRVRPDIQPGLRGMIKDDYLILYRLIAAAELVQVIRIVHQRCDLTGLFAKP